jgi:hypothetical protein
MAARFTLEGEAVAPALDPALIERARIVLQCPQWRDIEEAVSGKLTVGRFFKNLFGAFGRDDIRIDVKDPPTDCQFDEAP